MAQKFRFDAPADYKTTYFSNGTVATQVPESEWKPGIGGSNARHADNGDTCRLGSPSHRQVGSG